MIMITGQKPILKARQAGFQIVDIVATMRPLTKMSRQIVSADSIPTLVRGRALRRQASGAPVRKRFSHQSQRGCAGQPPEHLVSGTLVGVEISSSPQSAGARNDANSWPRVGMSRRTRFSEITSPGAPRCRCGVISAFELVSSILRTGLTSREEKRAEGLSGAAEKYGANSPRRKAELVSRRGTEALTSRNSRFFLNRER
jgi:hypothetical protein